MAAEETLTKLQVQERALKTVPDLCESVDYAEVSTVLFPRVCVRLFSTCITIGPPSDSNYRRFHRLPGY